VLRGRPRTVAGLRQLAAEGVPTYCCAVSWAEIFAGIRAGEEAHGVEIGDALIAATATAAGLHLWTLSTRHFPMDDLRLYRPGSDPGAAT
jgi:predicted nucleic acid-binding protein